MALKRAVGMMVLGVHSLFGGGVLGDGLGALRDGVLGELSGKEESNGGLDLAARDGGALVVVGETGRLSRDPLEDVVHEGVHDGHGFGGDSSVGVDLLQDFVDVDGEGFLPLLPSLFLVAGSDGFLGLSGFLDGFS